MFKRGKSTVISRIFSVEYFVVNFILLNTVISEKLF